MSGGWRNRRSIGDVTDAVPVPLSVQRGFCQSPPDYFYVLHCTIFAGFM
jgi:hypothetical protein